MSSIFLTFNENSEAGRNTALRMQTISNLYGMAVNLPVRLRMGSELDTETKSRIKASSFVVAFALEGLAHRMRIELQHAIALKKPIIVLYNPYLGKTLEFEDYKNVKEFFLDYSNTDETLHQVADFMDSFKYPAKEKNQNGAGVALVGIGLGLLALWALSKES